MSNRLSLKKERYGFQGLPSLIHAPNTLFYLQGLTTLGEVIHPNGAFWISWGFDKDEDQTIKCWNSALCYQVFPVLLVDDLKRFSVLASPDTSFSSLCNQLNQLIPDL